MATTLLSPFVSDLGNWLFTQRLDLSALYVGLLLPAGDEANYSGYARAHPTWTRSGFTRIYAGVTWPVTPQLVVVSSIFLSESANLADINKIAQTTLATATSITAGTAPFIQKLEFGL